MKLKTNIQKAVSILLAVALLTNCTAYRPVKQSPTVQSTEKEIILVKDDLKFKLVDYYYRGDTIVTSISHDIAEPPKSLRLVLYMKKDQSPVLDDQGRTLVPLSGIEYMEYFEVDKPKSRKNTIILVCGIVAGGVVAFTVMVAYGFSQLLDPENYGHDN